jgi:hypothetical protein
MGGDSSPRVGESGRVSGYRRAPDPVRGGGIV